jgi:hypothetical protein
MVVETTSSATQTSGAFFLLQGHCFQMVKSEFSLTTYCDEPVVWKGPWRDVKGDVWTVEACAKHRPDTAS